MIVAALMEKKWNYLKIFCLLDNPLFTNTMLYFSNVDNFRQLNSGRNYYCQNTNSEKIKTLNCTNYNVSQVVW